MRSGFRFDPPQIELAPAFCWALGRGLGPRAGLPSDRPPGPPDALLEAAAGLDLGVRIAARTPFERLVDELGAEGAERLRGDARAAGARMVVFEQVCAELAELAGRAGLALVFLKGMALDLAGVVPIGHRPCSDIDLLTRSGEVEALQRRLVEAGFREIECVPGEHQLAPLVHPSGATVEVHRMVRGVRLSGHRSATAEELVEARLCRRLESLPGDCLAPVDELLLAHLLVHGIAQHGLALSYPLSRLVADVEDLAVGCEGRHGLLVAAHRVIAADVTREEAEAVLGLATRLEAGEPPALLAAGNDGAARLLRHLVWAAGDDTYRRSLRLRAHLGALPGKRRAATLARNAFRSIWLADSQVEALYGRPVSRLGYLGWRLWRPLDLVARALRYGTASLELRLRRHRALRTGRTQAESRHAGLGDLVLVAGALRLTRMAQRLRSSPLDALLGRMVRAWPRIRTTDPGAAVAAAVRAGARVARWLDGLDSCLTRSLVAGALLAGRGDVVVCVGCRPGSESSPFDGHAWLEIGGARLEPRRAPDAERRPYATLVAFALGEDGVTVQPARDVERSAE